MLPWSIVLRIMCMNCNLQKFGNGYGVCNYRKKLFVSIGCWCIALLISDCLRKNQQYAYGMHCGAPIESILHVFWLRPMIKQFWIKLFLLLRHHYSRSVFSWGVVLWVVLQEILWGMKVCMLVMSFIFHMDTSLSPHFFLLFVSSVLKIWLLGVLLRRLALWIIWEARCVFVFYNVHIHLHIMLIDFGMLFVHTLCG